jgi:mono/diheme cytochrome c family protein
MCCLSKWRYFSKIRKSVLEEFLMVGKILRFIGIFLVIVVLLIVVFAGFAYFRSESMVAQTYAIPDIDITIPSDPAAIERGRYLAHSVSVCVDCHGANLEGGLVVDDPMLGRVAAPNLTTGPGGFGGELSDADIARVLRYGVLPNGQSAKIMPSEDYQHLTDDDLAAIIAYVRSVPPQTSNLPATQLGPLGRVLMSLGQLPILVAANIDPDLSPRTVTPGVTPEYGSYLADIGGCTGCHGPGLSGGPVPGTPPDWPPAKNLTPSGELANWNEAEFIQTVRTGINPSGVAINPVMPWARYASMTDDDLKAIWAFLQSVPAKPAGTR